MNKFKTIINILFTMEKTLTLDGKTAREIYPTSPPELKKLLENNFTKEFFSQNYRDYIHSWEGVCKELGKDPLRWVPFPNTTDPDELAENSHWRITQSIKLFKKGNKCDFKPGNKQSKTWAWMEHGKHPSGLGFSYTDSYYDGTGTTVGPRLLSLSAEDHKHIFTVVCKDDVPVYFNE